MSNEDMQWLPAIYAQFGGERFTLSDLHRKVCRATNPAMRPEVEADYRETIERLEGFIERSNGPRGGEGYCLTPRGFACGKRTHERASA